MENGIIQLSQMKRNENYLCYFVTTPKVKRDLPILVVLGNPPYSANSANKGEWIIDLVRKSYYPKDEIKEQNPKLLLDDYVKFIRWGQWRIEHNSAINSKIEGGVLAFITNHGYLDNPTFRGMRKTLIDSFTDIYILNLHGNAKKKECSPDGSKDENVFDIQQGVSIGIFIKKPKNHNPAKVHYAELWGNRESKYGWLQENSVASTTWIPLEPKSIFYLFSPQDATLQPEYEQGFKITEIMKVNSTGIKTHRDHFALDFDRSSLQSRIEDFRNLNVSDEAMRERYNLADTRDWKLSQKRRILAIDPEWQRSFIKCFYRTFDLRPYYHNDNVVELLRNDVMQHMLLGNNIGLCTNRQVNDEFRHIFCSRHVIDDCTVSLATRERTYLFPLYLYLSVGKGNSGEKYTQQQAFDRVSWPPSPNGRIPNLNPDFVSALSHRLGLKFVSDGHGDLTTTFGPEDIFDYIYSVFHSPTYRQRYADFLKIDFPRVPLTSNPALFRKLCVLGEELVALHLLESPQLTQLITRYPVSGDNFVEKGFPKFIVYEEGKPGYIYINKTQYFEGVPKDVWDFHVGGYQVCEKWLKDRKGRQLSFDDLMHYQKVIVALQETMRLMAEIDKAIPDWPIS